jgi:dipeptidyl-peptidase 4
MNQFSFSLRVLPALLLLLADAAVGQQKELTLEDLFHPDRKVSFEGTAPIGFKWLMDGEHYVERVDEAGSPLAKVNARTGERSRFFDSSRLETAFSELPGIDRDAARKTVQAANFITAPDEKGLLMYHDNDIFHYSLADDRLVRLTSSAELEKEAAYSPDGNSVAFVRGNNLFVASTAGGQEKQLTQDGSEKLLNGILDWVYQEELYGRGNYRAFWWSPDSARLAFLQLSEDQVPVTPIVDHTSERPALEQNFYPRPGDPNPKVRLGVVAAAGGPVDWVDQQNYGDEEILIVRVGWSPGGQLVYQVQNRVQTWLDLNLWDQTTRRITRLLRETSKGWVEVRGEPLWLADGSFLWLSDRDGWTHVYHHSREGTFVRAITSGEWSVSEVHGMDRTGWLYFSAVPERTVETQIFRIQLNGGQLTQLTQPPGSHSAEFNPTFTMFLNSWSDVLTPPRAAIHSASGSQVVRLLAGPTRRPIEEFRLSRPEFLKVKSRDGFELDAFLIKPLDFDAAKRYPVLVSTYAGPQSPTVRNRWNGLGWHQFLAQEGYLIWGVDPRGASGRGPGLAWPSRGNLGELELRDVEDSLDWLKEQPWVDGARIGVWGWSYGGYFTAYALTHSTSFKVGIAGAPVTDWRLYDSIYTERFMGLPKDNREGYDRSSVLKAAANLHGRLLLIHGLIDDNVQLDNSVRLIYELQKAGRQFEVMFYPNSRHGVTIPALNYHMYLMMTEFIRKNL